VAVAILLFAPLLAYIPKPALAGLLLATAARLSLRATRRDAGLVLVTAITAVVVDLDTALLLGVPLSILLFVPRAAKLKGAELIVTPGRSVREPLASEAAVDSELPIYDLESRNVVRRLRPAPTIAACSAPRRATRQARHIAPG
jgi:sulfate permease, SulP family